MKYNTDNYFQLKETNSEDPLLDTYKMKTKSKSFCLNSQLYTPTAQLNEEEQLLILNLFEKVKYNFKELNKGLEEGTLEHVDFFSALDFLRDFSFLEEYKSNGTVVIQEDSYLAVLKYLLIEVSPKLVGEIAYYLNEGNDFNVAMEKSKNTVKKHLCLIDEKIEAIKRNIHFNQTKVLDIKIRAIKEMQKKMSMAKKEMRKEINEQNSFILSYTKGRFAGEDEKENMNATIHDKNK